MRRYIIIILSLLLVSGIASASNDGGTQSPFSFGAGARDLSLGGASLAVSDATTAPFWNASRLASAEHFSLSGFHSRLYDSDVAYQYFGLVVPTMDLGVFGLGIFRLGIGGIEKRDTRNLLLGEIEDNRLAVYLAYARSVSNYDFGLAVTLEHHSLDEYKATSTPGINLSASRRFDFNKKRLQYFSIAFNGKNVFRPGKKLVDENVKYPYGADLGFSLGLSSFPQWNQSAIISISISKVDFVDPRLNMGLEYCFDGLLYVRGGIRKSQLSFGTGISYKNIKFDYALIDRDMGFLHMFALTTSLGTPLSEKRKTRAIKRERQFTELMNDRLVSRNREMITQLIQQGEEMLDAGDLEKASGSFDKALFLTRNSGLDTTRVSLLASEAKERFKDVSRSRRYRQYLDSAQMKLNAKDFWAAKHFANLALSEMPNSADANSLLQQASDAFERTSSREEMIQRQLWMADSLLNYAKIDEALSLIADLTRFAPGNKGVELALKKANFEHWKAAASSAYAGEDYEMATKALDSALAYFPGHRWCLNLLDRIDEKSMQAAEQFHRKSEAKPEPLSEKLQKQVDVAYKTAQEFFKKGELFKAIEYWERVERLAPAYLSVRKYLINVYKFIGVDLYGQDRLEEAITIWKKAAQLDPDNMEISSFIKRTKAEIRKLQEMSYNHE